MNKYFDIWEPVLKAFENQYPHIANKVIDWYPSGQNTIIVKTESGERYSYMYISNVIRRIEMETDMAVDDMDEIQWRNEFAMTLTRKMASVGMPQWRLAQITGISEVSISKYINAKSTPSSYNIRKIARALGCNSEELTNFIV